MHRAAYAELGIDAIYQRLPLPPALFDDTVRALPESGFRGINVTIPHKEAALAIADEASDSATAIGAANTLSFEGGRIRAENTDAPGLIAALDRELSGITALVLGAGGTGRAAAWALKNAGAEVVIWNRTTERAELLAEDLELRVHVADHPMEIDLGMNIVVNCTSLGMDGSDEQVIDFVSIHPQMTVVDFVYGDRPTAYVKWAREVGCDTIDGKDLLARQGALSFASWFAVDAPYELMRAALD